MGKKIVFLLASLFTVWIANGQNTIIKGVVTDSITGERLPYVSLIFKGTTIGTATDGDGNFSFSALTDVKNLEVSYLGYDTKEVKVIPGKTNNLKIKLAPNGITLNEVVVKPKKEKYSKKENPAVKFVKQVIASRESNDPRNHDYFQYDQYEKMVFAMNDYHPKPKKNGKPGKFDFLIDFVDTLDVGTTILPVSEKEKVESVYYRKEPKSEKRIVKGNKSSGVDEIFSRDGIQQFLNEVFREVDIFKNDIPLFLQRFVSSAVYYRTELLQILSARYVKCERTEMCGFGVLLPFNSETIWFHRPSVCYTDSTFFVQKAILNVPKTSTLNFVSGMTIES